MSWSVNAVGLPVQVAESIKGQISRAKCTEPEETIKNKVGEVIDKALSAFPKDQPVKVEASGSQSHKDYSNQTPEVTNSLNVKVEPIWGFLGLDRANLD